MRQPLPDGFVELCVGFVAFGLIFGILSIYVPRLFKWWWKRWDQ